ncbi:hypothetical protein [Amycolatopsis minnesotensis]|uniref:DNA-binding SARP family transcriptional activator n=1 Tax=Amycolatopsis minnesotensis TaxID=337894 RepID=A0ABN2Q0U4_9PSEU
MAIENDVESSRSISADDVKALRFYLRDDMRTPRTVQGRRILPSTTPPPEVIERLAPGVDPAHLRATLARHLVRFRLSGGLASEDLWLWWDATGLTSDPVSVTRIAEEAGVTRRTVERRLDAVDASIALILTVKRPLFANTAGDPLRATNLLALRAEAVGAIEPERDAAAVDAFAVRTLPHEAPQIRSASLPRDKDKRYRDSWRVPSRLLTMAGQPPLRPSRPIAGTGLTLTNDPHDALRQLTEAYAAGRANLYEFLLLQADRAIPDIHVAGPLVRLALLEIAYAITRDAENIVALRYARAWEAEAAALRSPGERDLAVLRARAGQAHICQIFGWLDSANELYRSAAQVAVTGEFGHHRRAAMIALHDVLGQIALTETLLGRRRETAMVVLDRMARVADGLAGVIEVEFTLARRRFEVEFGFSTSKHTLSPLPVGRAHDRSLLRAQDEFFAVAAVHPSANRLLAAADLGMAWAIRERDQEAGKAHFARFTHVSEHIGSFANLSYRMQSRIRSAVGLLPDLAELPEVPGLAGPWRGPGQVPSTATGLLVYPRPGR